MDASITPLNKTFDTVNKAGIWFAWEFPTLRQGYLDNRVHQIDAVSPDGKTRFQYWQSGDRLMERGDDAELVKRGSEELNDLEDMFDDEACYM